MSDAAPPPPTEPAEVDRSTVPGTPIWFAREVLGIDLYPWQEKILWDLAVGDKPVVVKAANGSGKTKGIALVAILWHAAVFEKSQAITTAGVYRQVKEMLWAEIRQHQGKLGSGWKMNTTDFEAPNGSRAIGFSTDEPHKFEGWHNNNQLIILDEAKSIPDEIWQAVQRCNVPDGGGGKLRILIMSSTAGSEGFFAEAFTTKRKYFSCHSVTAFDCPHLSDKWINEQIEKWGRNHALVRSMIFSEFVDSGVSGYVIPSTVWERCLSDPPEFEAGRKLAFIDWAAGGDENVLCILHGNKVEKLICWRDKNTMAAANKAAIELLANEVPLDRIFADDGGLGHPINDALAVAGFPVRRVLNNMKSSRPDHFQHMGAELWYEAAASIKAREFILPDDDVLMEQATTRKTAMTATGKLGLEKKDDLRARGLSSPDRADAVLAAIALAKATSKQYDMDEAVQFDYLSDSQIEATAQDFDGCFAGL